jgi:hypothetical protein
MEEGKLTEYVHYSPPASTHIEEDGEGRAFLCVRFIDVTTMDIINEFRYEDPNQFREIADLLQDGAQILESLDNYGYEITAKEFGLEIVNEADLHLDVDNLTVDDILKAKEED